MDWVGAVVSGAHEILPGQLWQSPLLASYGMLLEHPNLTVISMIDTPQMPFRPGKVHVVYPINDGPELPDMQIAWQVAGVGSAAIEQGGATLVHCAAGINRSGLMCGLILSLLKGWSGVSIIAAIRKANPIALQNTVFYEFLEGLG